MTEGGSINREAWAELVDELIARETKGKKLPFARLIGVDATTVSRWLRREVAVKEESVRAVARALNLPPVSLLIQVGYYSSTELAPPIPADPHEDPVIKQIMADRRWNEAERAELVQEQIEQIEADLKRREEEYERLVRRLASNRDA